MGKVKFGIDADDAIGAEAGEGGSFYDGPIPPRGAYRGVLKRLELVAKNGSGDPMLRYLIELKAKPNTEASKYDGYGVWGNQNVTDQGKGYVNQFLDALTNGSDEQILATRKAFWGGQLVVEDEGEGHVIRIGKMQIGSPSGSRTVAFTGKRTTYKGEEKLEVQRFLVSKEEEEPVDVESLEELPEEELPAEDNSDDEGYDDDPGDDDSPMF